jgi:catechol 2,3-dioxygenase-like lactoylglutathione lyase family enzyme
MQEKIRIAEVNHICVIVKDIDRSLEKFKRIFDVPPIKVEEYSSTARLKGKELGKYKLKLAMVRIAKNLVLEFLQIVEGKSVELAWLKKHGQTIHHIAFKVENMENEAAEWEKRNIGILQEDHGKWIYLNTEDLLGTNIELVPL